MKKPKKKRSLERSKCRWDDNIKINLRKEDSRVWHGFVWVRIGVSGGSYEHRNELLEFHILWQIS
jgi:hypothetical protein